MNDMDAVNEIAMRGGRSAIYARRIVFALSLGCLIVAAGMMVVWLATQFRETLRRNAEKEAKRQEAAAQNAVIIPGLSVLRDDELRECHGSMTFVSQHQSTGHGMRFYDGNVRIFLLSMSIECQHVQREADGLGSLVRLAGYGGVVVRGVAPFSMLKADNFVFDNRDRGLLTLAGEVQVEGPEGLKKYRLCVIALNAQARDSQIVRTKSLLDDFVESQTMVRKLALLDDITRVYSDDELPPEAAWLLAMKLLERHLTWHGERGAGGAPAQRVGEQGARSGKKEKTSRKSPESGVKLDPAVWPEAHCGEAWMREGAEGKAYWRLGERRHVDVVRAVRLLGRPGADAMDNERRREWLTEIQRNNTILRMVVEPVYRPHATATVTLDVRNAGRLMLKFFRVGNGAAWAAVRQRQGRDFIYADGTARFAALSATTVAGPKKLGELMENLIVEWSVAVSKLPANEDLARAPSPGG